MNLPARILALCLLLTLISPAPAAPTPGAPVPTQTDLLKLHWTAFADPEKSPIKLTAGAGGLVVTVDNLKDNKGETYPHINVGLGGVQDWRNYQSLRLRMRLTSDSPQIMAGGKNLAFIFFDGKAINEMNNGGLQQGAGARLRAGDWQDIVVNLRPLSRSEISGFDVHFYIQPYGFTHQFKVEISQCELVKDKGVLFDGKGMSEPLQGGGASAAERLTTPDGFTLGLGPDGGVAEAKAGEHDMANAGMLGGILVRDHATDAPPVPAGGSLRADGDALVQQADVASFGVHVDGRYAVEGNLIHVTMKVANQTKETRYLTVYFAVPLKKQAWTWHNDIHTTYAVGSSARPCDVTTVQYPLAAMTGPDSGIALALALDQPRNYRLGYNEATGILYAAFDVALIDAQTPAGQSLNEAECNVYLYPCDPKWGMRSALQAYYDAFPQWFANRLKQNGGWEWSRLRKDLTPEQLVASGCRVDWGTPGGDTAKWNTEHGVLNTIYLEVEYIQMSLTDLTPSEPAALNRIRNLAAGDEEEWKKFSVLSYTRNSTREQQQKLAQAILSSGQVDENGQLRLNIGYRPDWIGENGLSVMVPCNIDPQIPGGRGQFALDFFRKAAEDFEKAGFVHNGWALDSYQCDDAYDYGAEHFRYSSIPVTYDPDRAQPAQLERLTMAAWIHALADWGRPKDQMVIGNLIGNFTFSVPYLDVFGTESGCVADPAYQRAMAYRRTVTYLPYTPKPDLDVAYNLLYAAYPGRGLEMAQYETLVPLLDLLNAAGWEPVTDAQVSAPKVRVERYGSGDHCYLVFFNPDSQAATFRVTLDAEALKGDYAHAKVLFGPQKDQEAAIEKGVFSLHLDSRQTAMVRLE